MQPDVIDQPRIPGVRYRKETRQRTETITVDGQTETRLVDFRVWVPVPPRDWDRIIVTALTTTALIVTALAVTGTTASIGTLLATLVPPVIAYSVAVIFDVTWLACVAVEWLERLDPQRAKTARHAGWVSLGISIAAVVAYGHHQGQTAAGVVASAVSLLAKGLWVFVLRYHAVPLSENVAFWLNRRREKAAASLALARQVRKLDAHDAYMAVAFGTETAREITARTMTQFAPDADGPDGPDGPDGVATVSGTGSGPDTETVPAITDTGQDRAGQHGHDMPGHGQDAIVVPISSPSKAETIRTTLADAHRRGVELYDESLIAAVIAVHGAPVTHDDSRKLADTVRRTRSRIEGRKKTS